jgi:outer membrane murein-binding lipoprotein Lpp
MPDVSPSPRRAGWVALGIVLACAGCQSCEPLEAELRDREAQLHDLGAEVNRLRACNDALQHEVNALRPSASAKVPPELASQTYALTTVTLGRQTGGYNADDTPGDEALQVILEPRDPDGSAIKAPGTVEVYALEVTPDGMKRPLCAWLVTPDQLRRSWRSGLLSTGYFLVLPWKAWPGNERLRVVVRFVLPDGRSFEADKDVTIRLTPPDRRKPVSTEYGDPPSPRPPELETPLPLPRKVEPPPAEGPALSPRSAGPEAAPLTRAVRVLKPVPRP